MNKIFKRNSTYIALFCIGLVIKFMMLPVSSSDYQFFLKPWIDFIKAHQYCASLHYKFYNYSPSYIYILIIIAKLGVNSLSGIKIVSIVFEYLMAFFVGKIAQQKYKTSKIIWICLAIIPILPTVILNSSYFSQCDSIYSTFVIGSIYCVLKKRQLPAVIFLGVAFAFKMQTAILFPFFFIAMLKGNIRWYFFILIPILFTVSLLPAYYYGRSLMDLFNVYLSQSERYPYLTMNFPNLYIWIDNIYYHNVKIIGIAITFIAILIVGIWLGQKKCEFSYKLWIQLVFLSSIVTPFLLPGMHERYMYLGDVLGVLYFLVLRKNIHLPFGIIIVSFYSYIRCSRYNEILPMWPAFLVYLTVIVFTLIEFAKSLKNEISTTSDQQ